MYSTLQNYQNLIFHNKINTHLGNKSRVKEITMTHKKSAKTLNQYVIHVGGFIYQTFMIPHDHNIEICFCILKKIFLYTFIFIFRKYFTRM